MATKREELRSVMYALIENTIPKNLSQDISVRVRMLDTSERTETSAHVWAILENRDQFSA